MLITGAAQRIGRALALDFAHHGWRVAVHYNSSREPAAQVVAQIEEQGGQALAVQADLSDLAQLHRLLPACQKVLGPVSCLINNASIFNHDRASTMSADSWDTHLDINLRAPVFLAQSLARHLPAGMSANIINLIDQRVWNMTPDFFSYTISKAGLFSATQTLAQALAPDIRVNAIGPGPVMQSIHQSPAEFDQERRATPLHRGTSPEEIANAIRFILDAPAMSGQMIALDGGQHLAGRIVTPDAPPVSADARPDINGSQKRKPVE